MESILQGIHIRFEGLRHPFGYPSIFPDIEYEGMPGEVARSLVARGVGWQVRLSSGIGGGAIASTVRPRARAIGYSSQ
jgi:hypothetical protein